MTKKELKAVIKSLNKVLEADQYTIEETRDTAEVRSLKEQNIINLFQLLKFSTLGAVNLLKLDEQTHTNYLKVYFY